ncbi:hypothetical protein HMPREF1548_00561 [Clostridium sp. KLE 1755]|nr:hypothetical protein HMPREF1548_00561 [Clostridium sp. KLE 1755]
MYDRPETCFFCAFRRSVRQMYRPVRTVTFISGSSLSDFGHSLLRTQFYDIFTLYQK